MMKNYIYGSLFVLASTGMGICSEDCPQRLSLNMLEDLARTNELDIDVVGKKQHFVLTSAKLSPDVSVKNEPQNNKEALHAMLPEKAQIMSKGKIFGLGESFAKLVTTTSNHDGSELKCEYTFRTFSGAAANKKPSELTIEKVK